MYQCNYKNYSSRTRLPTFYPHDEPIHQKRVICKPQELQKCHGIGENFFQGGFFLLIYVTQLTIPVPHLKPRRIGPKTYATLALTNIISRLMFAFAGRIRFISMKSLWRHFKNSKTPRDLIQAKTYMSTIAQSVW